MPEWKEWKALMHYTPTRPYRTIQELYEPMRNRLIENFNIDKKNDKFDGNEEASA